MASLNTLLHTNISSSFCVSPCSTAAAQKQSRSLRNNVRAEAAAPINPSIRKDEPKVVDTVKVTELEKPLQAYCRCWRSGTFPLCDGTHAKHNKETGDNVGPLLLKK